MTEHGNKQALLLHILVYEVGKIHFFVVAQKLIQTSHKAPVAERGKGGSVLEGATK